MVGVHLDLSQFLTGSSVNQRPIELVARTTHPAKTLIGIALHHARRCHMRNSDSEDSSTG